MMISVGRECPKTLLAAIASLPLEVRCHGNDRAALVRRSVWWSAGRKTPGLAPLPKLLVTGSSG